MALEHRDLPSPSSMPNCSDAAPRNAIQTGVTATVFGKLDYLLHAAVLAACLLALSSNQAEPDLWGHVQYARDSLHKGLGATATYTYTAEGTPWINHELISEFLFAGGVDTIGVSGLLIAKSGLAFFVLFLIMSRAFRLGISPFVAYFITILTATNLTFFWVLRPQLFSLVFFTLLLTILNWCFAGWEGKWQLSIAALRSPRWLRSQPAPPALNDALPVHELNYSSQRMRFLWLVPLLLFVWANTHGAFLAGLCFFIAYLTLRSVEAVACRGREAIGLLKRFAMMIAASILATFLNPYSVRLHLWLVESLIPPRPEIVEWLPPQFSWELSSIVWVPFWLLLAITVASLFVSKKPKDITHLVLFALLIWQAVEHRRHIALVALTFAMWMPIHINELLKRLGFGRDSNSVTSAFSPRVRWAFVGLFLFVFTFIGANLYEQTRLIVVRKDLYPVSAFQYVVDQKLNGKMVVGFDWAQYAIMAFGAPTRRDPGLQFSFDGRYDTCYPREVVDMYFDFEIGDLGPGSRYRGRTSPPKIDGQLVLEFNQPDFILISRNRPEALKNVARQKERWVVLYQDSLAQLWGRAEKFDDPHSVNYIAPEDRRISDESQTDIVAWPALPKYPVTHPSKAHISSI